MAWTCVYLTCNNQLLWKDIIYHADKYVNFFSQQINIVIQLQDCIVIELIGVYIIALYDIVLQENLYITDTQGTEGFCPL